jgi:hypothetical protein
MKARLQDSAYPRPIPGGPPQRLGRRADGRADEGDGREDRLSPGFLAFSSRDPDDGFRKALDRRVKEKKELSGIEPLEGHRVLGRLG